MYNPGVAVGLGGAGGTVGALAVTGFSALFYALVAVTLVMLGLITLRLVSLEANARKGRDLE